MFKKGQPASGSQGVPAASGSQGVPAASGSQASDMGDIERTIASFNSLFVKTFGLAQGTSIMSAAYSFADFANKVGWRNRVPAQASAAAQHWRDAVTVPSAAASAAAPPAAMAATMVWEAAGGAKQNVGQRPWQGGHPKGGTHREGS